MSREALLDATTRLVCSGEIDGIDVDRIVAAAGSSLDEYRRLFPDDEALLDALHSHHVSTLVGEIGALTDTLPPGRLRLERAIETFWAGCIARIPVRRLVKRGRGSVLLDGSVLRKNRAFEYLLLPELKSIGDPAPEDDARLLRALVEEVAQAEYEAGTHQPQLRAALWRMLDSSLDAPLGHRADPAD